MGTTLTTGAAHAQAPQREASFTWETHASEAGTRRYKLYLPARYDGKRAVPLVVMLHGCTQDPDDFAAGTRMNAVAEEHGFLVAYPEQTAASHPQKCWSWYDPAHQGRDGGEPAILAGITREVMARHRVDPARVYVAGVSAGGGMALILAATHPDLFAAAGVHSGIAYRAVAGVPQALQAMQKGAADTGALGPAALAAMGPCARPVPLIVFHGGTDPVVRAVNADQVVHQWAAVSEGAGRPLRAETEPAPSGEFTAARTRFVDSEGRVVIESWVVPGLEHAWSGGSAEGTYTDPRGPDASREMVRFLLQHRR